MRSSLLSLFVLLTLVADAAAQQPAPPAEKPAPPAVPDLAIEAEAMVPTLIGPDDNYPKELVGGYRFGYPDGKARGDGVQNGVLKFTVKAKTIVYLVADYGYQGNNGGGWAEERLTREQLRERGWEDLGAAPWDMKLLVFRRLFDKGEKVQIRTNKYWPPMPIVPPPPKAKTPVASRVPQPAVPNLAPLPMPEAPAVKLAAPDAASEKSAMAIVVDIYKADWEKAKTVDQQIGLARKMLVMGSETQNDAVGKFVLLKVARDMAAKAGDLQGALAAASLLGSHYEIDSLAMSAGIIETSLSSGKASKQLDQAAPQIAELLDQALAQDQYEVARRFATSLRQVARTTRKKELLAQADAKGAKLDQLEREYALAATAIKTAAGGKATADQNAAAGKYYCFTKGNWEKGLPLLAKGSDAALAACAQADLAPPDSSEAELALANQWWQVSEALAADKRAHIRERAAHWYRSALPMLAGLSKAKAQGRIQEVEKAEKAPEKGEK